MIGENFPYTNFHDLNMDWIIKIAKDFLDQYTHIQELIEQGKTDIETLTNESLTSLQDKADALEGLLQDWYDTHSQDIADQLADALSDLNDWYTEHSEDIADELTTALSSLQSHVTQAISDFDQAASTRAASAIATIPSDYSDFYADTMGMFLTDREILKQVDKPFTVSSYEGSLYKTNGDFVTDVSGYYTKSTSLIPCVPGEKFYYRGKGYSEIASWVLYGHDGTTVIGGATTNSVGTAQYYELTIPSNAFYVRFQSYDVSSIAAVILEVLQPKNKDANTLENKMFNTIAVNKGNIQVFPGHFWNTNGSYGTDGNGWYGKWTEKIPCYPGQKFYYKGYSAYGIASIVLWDYNGKFIGAYQYDSNMSYTEITIQANVYWCAFSSISQHTDTQLEVLSEHEYERMFDNYMFNKKWTICGDSFSESSWTEPSTDNFYYPWNVYKVYGYHICKRNHMRINMMARSGYAMSDFMGIYQTIPTDSDYITLAFGLNDTSRSTPIGNINDTASNNTFYGYWNTALDWIYVNCPKAKIAILILPSYMGSAYREAELNIAKKFGIAVLDMFNDPKVPMFMYKDGANSTVEARTYDVWRVSPGNNHPSLDCHKFMSTFIENFMKSI